MFNLLFYLKNMKLFLQRHKLFSIVIVCLVILIPLLVSAVGSMGEGYRIEPGVNGTDWCRDGIRVPLSTGMVDPIKRKICNKGTNAYFVPTKTFGEWNSFYYVVAPQVLEDLTLHEYCGDGVCQQGENCDPSGCCPDCTASAAYCHGNGICATAELPVGYGNCAFRSVDCKWRSSNDYATNYFKATGANIGTIWGSVNGCYSASSASFAANDSCWTAAYSSACSAIGFYPPSITSGYYLFQNSDCTGENTVQ